MRQKIIFLGKAFFINIIRLDFEKDLRKYYIDI